MTNPSPSESKTAIVTGSAGFIGFHLSKRLLAQGWNVVGIDELNDYYAPALKQARNKQLLPMPGYRFHQADLAQPGGFSSLLSATPDVSAVFHLAAQAGVRMSLDQPALYVRRNIEATFQVIDAIQKLGGNLAKPTLFFASSSSVYGNSNRIPFREDDPADQPVSFYGATKRSCELLIRSYHAQFGLKASILRLFTVYGPWGRPDMAISLFTKKILADETLDLFYAGRMTRDFTYVDDVVESILRLQQKSHALAPFGIYNVGGSQPRPLADFVSAIEKACATGKPLRTRNLPFQTGDVKITHADSTLIERLTGFRPQTPLETGVTRFVEWYRGYHHC
ncbi:MAG: NAD-dependent epimerase/dehydratase family protein [Bdellovibrionota bacterium]